jgi:hypothetical protein
MDVPRSVIPKLFIHREPNKLYLHPLNTQWVFLAFNYCENDTFMTENNDSTADQIRADLNIAAVSPILIVSSTKSGILDLISTLKNHYDFKKVNSPLEEICGDQEDNLGD